MENVPLKSRAQGAVNSERMQLLSIIAHHWDEIENYELSSTCPKNKWDIWEKIANEFNSHPSVTVTRTPLQVKTLFKNMKTKAKKYKAKLDIYKSSGITIESDLVSEIVLQLTEFQNKESLDAFLEFLKNLRYYDPKTKMPVTPEDDTEFGGEVGNSRESSMSPEWMTGDCDDVPDIKEEVIEAFDSPCIIREDVAPLSFPTIEEKSNDSTVNQPSSSESNVDANTEDSAKSSEVHTFGDISVTPLSSESKKNIQNGLKIVSPGTLGINVHNSSRESESPKSTSSEVGPISNRVILQPKSVISKSASVGLLNLSNLIDHESLKRSSINNDTLSQHNKQSQNLTCSVSEKFGKQQCCCPDYHKRMMTLAKKEHEMTVSLLNEKILAKREERRLHEEERKFREQTFLLKQEERRVSLAEHQARLKLIELECEAAQKRFRSNDRINKWLLRNGSKEI